MASQFASGVVASILKPGGKYSRDGSIGGIRLAEDILSQLVDEVIAIQMVLLGYAPLIPTGGPFTVQTTFHGTAVQDNSPTPLIIDTTASNGGKKIYGDHNGAVANGYTGPEISFNGQTQPPSITMGNVAGSNVSPDAGNTLWFLAGPPSSTTILSTGFVGIKLGDWAIDVANHAIWTCITAGTRTTAVWQQVTGMAGVMNPAHGYNDLLGASFVDPGINMTSTALSAAATVYFSRIPISGPFTLTSLFADVTGLGATLTHSYLAAWNSAGTLIGQTADQSAVWGTGGSTTTASAATALAGGAVAVAPRANDDFIWVGMYVGTTSGALPSTGAAIGSQTGNMGTTTVRTRFGSFAIANTSTLGNLTPASITGTPSIQRLFAIA